MMKRWLLVLLIVVAAAGSVCVVVIVRETRARDARPAAEARQHAEDPRQALRRAAEFLQPDVTSDIRFGSSKSDARSTPVPATPQ